MHIEILLNREAAEHQELVKDLRAELHVLEGMKGLKYDEVTVPAPRNVLSVEHDVVKFAFEHSGSLIPLATALLQLLRASIERRKISERKGDPPAVLVAGAKTLKIPASPSAERRFLKQIGEGRSPKKTRNKKDRPPRKSK
jgi:hypothetical protein